VDIKQIERISTAIAEVVTATAGLNALLVLELDKRGLLEKSAFAEVLRKHVTMLRETPHSLADGSLRHDLQMLEGVVGFLSGPPPKGWTPVVIEGGKS